MNKLYPINKLYIYKSVHKCIKHAAIPTVHLKNKEKKGEIRCKKGGKSIGIEGTEGVVKSKKL